MRNVRWKNMSDDDPRLPDRAAITEQMYRYARATDWLETEWHRDVFATDCVFASRTAATCTASTASSSG